ncbi:MAG: tetratricopeptide repeat protein [Acidobacteriaceae bacterium]|nr:tetratricopeptide repeat protein [Acidobacteriaceae bacterium]
MKKGAVLFLASFVALGISAQDNFDLLSRQATAALKSNPAEAAKLYRQAVALRPEWAEGWFYFGASLYQTGAYSESQGAFQRASQLAADNGSVWAFLGLCEYQMGSYPQSLRDIQKGEEIGLGDNKQFISAIRNHAALIYIRQAQFAAAMSQLQPLAAMGDDSAFTLQTIGRSVLGWKNAAPELSVRQKPLAEAAGRAWWAFWAGREDAALLFEKLVSSYPDQPRVHYLYGLYLEDSHPDAALREFEKEIRIQPSNIPARLQASALEMKASAPEKAVEIAQDAVRLGPSNAYCYVALGRAYLSANQSAKAASVLRTAVRLAPQDRLTHLYLAQAYVKLGKTADAEREQDVYKRLKTTQAPVLF